MSIQAALVVTAGAALTLCCGAPAAQASGLSFTTKTTADGLGADSLFGVYVSDSNVYAATNGGGLSFSTDGGSSFFSRTTADGLSND
jgi:hypothetical protein